MERDPNRIRIMGGGAEEVKSALLRAMARATDPVSLDFLLFCVVASREEGTIKFQGEKEWGIIAAAAERQSKNPWQNVQFFVMKDENGMPLLNLGAVRGTP